MEVLQVAVWLFVVSTTIAVCRVLYWGALRWQRSGAPANGERELLKRRLRRGGTRLVEQEEEVISTAIVLGSGGHSKEMLALLKGADARRYRITFFLSKTDSKSLSWAEEYLESCKAVESSELPQVVQFVRIPRSREVGQSYFLSIWSTAYAFLVTFMSVWTAAPSLVLVNGPGVCIPVCAAALLIELLCFRPVVLIFVESFCRVRTLSLTGRLLYPLANRFVVQWPNLTRRFPKAEYLGHIL